MLGDCAGPSRSTSMGLSLRGAVAFGPFGAFLGGPGLDSTSPHVKRASPLPVRGGRLTTSESPLPLFGLTCTSGRDPCAALFPLQRVARSILRLLGLQLGAAVLCASVYLGTHMSGEESLFEEGADVELGLPWSGDRTSGEPARHGLPGGLVDCTHRNSRSSWGPRVGPGVGAFPLVTFVRM